MRTQKRLDPTSFAMAALLTSLVAVAPLSTDMYLPALPAIGAYFNASTADVQMTLSIFLAGFAGAQLIVGPLSDRIGRRPVLVGGVLVFVLSTAACILAESMVQLIVARFFQAVGACAGGAVGRAVVRDIHTPKDGARLLAHMGSAMAMGPLVAPLIGGQLTALYGWQANFVFLGAMGMAVLIWAALTLPETHAEPDKTALSLRRMKSNYATLLRHRGFVTLTFANGFSFAGLFAFISGCSFVLIDALGMTPQTFGFAFGTGVLGYISGTQLAARLLKHHTTKHMVVIGGRIGLAAGLGGVASVTLLSPSVLGVIVPVYFFALSVGFIMPNSMAGAMAPFPRMAGAASALMGFLQMTIGAVIGAGVGWAYNGTAVPMMAAIAGCGLIAWVFSRHVEDEDMDESIPEDTPESAELSSQRST